MYNCTDSRDCNLIKSVSEQRIIEICKKFTLLKTEEINKLIEVSRTLSLISELEDCDVFIDCFTRNKANAIVIAQYSPEAGNFYNKDIVGELMNRDNEPGVFRTLELGVPSREVKAIVNENVIIRQSISPIKGDDNKVIGVLIMERNLNNLRGNFTGDNKSLEENHIKVDNGKFFNIAEYINEAMIYFNTQGIVIHANEVASEMWSELGFKDELVGTEFCNLVMGEYTFDEIIRRERIDHREIKIGKYILNVLYISMYDEEVFSGVLMLMKDITEIRINQRELILKTVAIDEIHHRVKNNLQTIVSLINFQARRATNAETKQVCKEIISRIYSISLTHEILSQKGVDVIDLKDILGKMVHGSKLYNTLDNTELEICLMGDNVYLQSEVASSVAMVVNELIQNSIKHAFKDRENGKIHLEILKGEGYSSVRVSDDGVGWSTEVTSDRSLGLKLVEGIVKDKLKGTIKYNKTEFGTDILFDFANNFNI